MVKKRKDKIWRNRIRILFFCFCCFASFTAGVQNGSVQEIGNIQDVFSQNIISNNNLPLSKMKIVVDAGHGGSDPGTVDSKTGTYEADLNLEISYRLKVALEELGATVIMTRTSVSSKLLADSRKQTIEERGEIIEKAKADLLLSIHQNYNDSSSTIRGAQILVRDVNSVNLANNLQNVFNNELNTSLNYIKKDYALLKYGNQQSVIVECGFLSNREDQQLLQTKKYQERLVSIVVQVVEDYWK
ncbi:MAG: N-acetylmuramoyl-L-alanine amidase [Aminipila sp.]